MERDLQSAHENLLRPAKRRRTQFGLKELAPGVNPDVDIVAIHGIDGDREGSWTADNGVLWLKDLLPEKIPNARILTYGYDANTCGQEQLASEYMHDHAITFISKLSLFREGTSTNSRAIIFVAHSSGGILLKSALIHSHLSNDDHLKHHHAISRSTYGVAFFSTPHQGSATAELARYLLDIASSMPTSTVLLRYIEKDSEAIQHQLAQYSAISAHYETKFFYELYDTPVAGEVSKRVVPKSSAVVPGALNAEAIGIGKDHVNIVKYRSGDDEDFKTVSSALSLMARVAHKKITEKGRHHKSTDGDILKEIGHTPSQQRALLNLPRVKAARFNADTRSPCLEGTRVDLLKTIAEWTEKETSEEHRRIFWLIGQAGTGKTTISLTVAGDCQTKNCLGASFFFSRDHAERSELQLVFPTLAHQLGFYHKPFQVQLTTALEEDPDIAQMEPGYQFRKLIFDPLMSCHSFPTPTIVVIDALDECRDKDPISKILTILSAYTHKITQLKFFITSRPEDHIREGFRPLCTQTQAFILHTIETSVVGADIEHYLRHGFSIAKSRYPEMSTQGWPSDESIQSLVRQSEGLFIFAATAMNFILDRHYDDPPNQFAILLGQSSAVETSSSPFAFLDQLYLQVLRQAFPSGAMPSRRLNVLRIILGALVFLRTPLSAEALESLLGLQTGLIRNTLRRLHSVIIVPDTSEHPIRLIHPSFFDFITVRCSDADFRINSLFSHEQLAIACFKQMKSLKRNICEIDDMSKLNYEIQDLAERIERYISPSIQYACLHWAFHLCRADGHALQGVLKEFCCEQILYWIEAISILGYVREGIRHLQDVSNFLNTPSEDLLEALIDSTRFMADVFEVISCASLQLYRSALPLLSPSNFLRKTFHRELDGGMRVLQGEWVPKSFGVTILRGSKSSINSVDVSPDGALVVSSSHTEARPWDRDDVRLWDRATGTLLQTLKTGPAAYGVCARFFPDGSRVIAVTSLHIILIWDVATGVCLQAIQLGDADPESHIRTWKPSPWFAISPDFTSVVGFRSKNISIWATSNGDLLKTLRGHSKTVNLVAFSPDHMLIASSSEDRTIRIWNASNGAALISLQVHSNSVESVEPSDDNRVLIIPIAFSPDSKFIISGSKDHDICLWNASSGVALKTLKGHTNFVKSIAFSPDGRRVISGSSDKTLRVWDVISGKLLKTIKCTGDAENVGFFPDGTQYMSSAGDIIYIWDAARAADLDHSNDWLIPSIFLSPGGTYIYSSGLAWHLWNGLTGTHLFSLRSDIHPSISPNDKYLLSNYGRRCLCLWDIPSRAILWITPIHSSGYYFHDHYWVTFSLDSTRIVSPSDDVVGIWDVATGNKLLIININPFPSAAFSYDGSQIITKYDKYDLPPHVRPQHILSLDEPLEQIKYFISDGWIFASNGTKEERCVWIPPDWRLGYRGTGGGGISYSYSHGRIAIGPRRGLVLLDLSDIHLAIRNPPSIPNPGGSGLHYDSNRIL